jgi:radical SAM superfamily enzyme YgiQ (UPF0313 family)
MAQIVLLTDFNMGAPEFHQRALGAYHVADYLRKADYSVQVVDFFFSLPDYALQKVIHRFVGPETRVVGISSNYIGDRYNDKSFKATNFSASEKLRNFLDECKVVQPKLKVLQGGPYSTAKNSNADFYLPGQNNEIKIRKVVDQIFERQSSYEKFDSTMFEHSFHASDGILENETLPIEISRGCIFNCKFCGFTLRGKKKNDYIKNPEVLLSQFQKNYDSFRTNRYYFADDTFNESMEKLEAVNSVIQKLPFRIEFVAYLRLDLLYRYRAMIPLLKEMGLKGGVFGVETFHKKSGIAIGKGLDPDVSKELLFEIRETWSDIALGSGFIAGLPHEPPAHVEQTNEWLLKNKVLDSWHFSPLHVSKSTESPFRSYFSDHIEEYGYSFTSDYEWHNEFTNFELAKAQAYALNKANENQIGINPWMIMNFQRNHNFKTLKMARNNEIQKFSEKNKLAEYLKLL